MDNQHENLLTDQEHSLMLSHRRAIREATVISLNIIVAGLFHFLTWAQMLTGTLPVTIRKHPLSGKDAD